MNAFKKVIGYETIKNELMQICDMVHNIIRSDTRLLVQECQAAFCYTVRLELVKLC